MNNYTITANNVNNTYQPSINTGNSDFDVESSDLNNDEKFQIKELLENFKDGKKADDNNLNQALAILNKHLPNTIMDKVANKVHSMLSNESFLNNTPDHAMLLTDFQREAGYILDSSVSDYISLCNSSTNPFYLVMISMIAMYSKQSQSLSSVEKDRLLMSSDATFFDKYNSLIKTMRELMAKNTDDGKTPLYTSIDDLFRKAFKNNPADQDALDKLTPFVEFFQTVKDKSGNSVWDQYIKETGSAPSPSLTNLFNIVTYQGANYKLSLLHETTITVPDISSGQTDILKDLATTSDRLDAGNKHASSMDPIFNSQIGQFSESIKSLVELLRKGISDYGSAISQR